MKKTLLLGCLFFLGNSVYAAYEMEKSKKDMYEKKALVDYINKQETQKK